MTQPATAALCAAGARCKPSSACIRRTKWGCAALVAVFIAMLALATGASAHATVDSSNPADGSRLQAAPALVSVTFDESVGLGGPAYFTVTDVRGQRVDSGSAYHPSGVGKTIAVKLRTGLGDGTYIASYRVVSADSHPVAGVIRFVVGTGELVTTGGGSVSAVNHGTSVLLDVARWVSYAGIALLGGAWLLLALWRAGRVDRRARRLVWTGWVLAAVGGVAELLLQGPYVAGDGAAKVASWTLLDNTLHTGYGLWHSTRLLLLGALAIAWAVSPRRDETERVDWLEELSWLLLGGVIVTFSVVGHAQTTNPEWLSITADALHLAAMATWIGGLAMLVLAVLPRRDPGELRDVLPIFSRVAFSCVGVLAVTGLYAAWRGIGMWRALFGTEYGVLVVLKVVLFVGLIALGNLSRIAINLRATHDSTNPCPPDGDAVTLERMRRSVLVELVLAVLVLVATSVLVGQPRGREAIAVSDAKAVHGVAAVTASRSAEVSIEPGKHGSVTVSIALDNGAVPQQVTATAAQQSRKIGPLPLTLKPDGSNRYRADAVSLPVAGTWTFHLVVTFSAANAVTTDVAVKLH